MCIRDRIVTTPGLSESISGAILFDETIRQRTNDGTPFAKALADEGIIPGIKVDVGAKPMAACLGEKVTEGLDGLRARLAEYVQMGARFAKARRGYDQLADVYKRQEFMYLRFVFLLVCSSAKRETLDIVHAVRVIVYLQMQSAIRPAFGGIGTMSNLGKFTRFLVRIALAGACVMPLVFLSLQAQSTTAPTNSGAVYNSRFDFATLYSYFQAHGADTDVGISYNNIRLGEYASGSYYFNRRLGLEAAFESHPDGNNDGLYDVEAGPIVRDNMKHISLFAHGLVGMGRLAGPNTRTCCNLGYTYHNPWTWGGPSLTAGGGLDINLIRVVSLRLFQIDYTYNNVDFGPYVPNTYINRNPLGGRAHLPGLQASAGLVWHMGNITPPLPVSYSCSVSPSVGFPGDPITVTGMAMNLNPNPKKTVSYTWSSDGGTISGTTNVANLDTCLLYTSESQVFMALSLLIGALTGLAVVAFIVLTERLGMRLYPVQGAPWRRLLLPVVGSLGIGYLLYRCLLYTSRCV